LLSLLLSLKPLLPGEELLIRVGDDWSFFKGTEEPPSEWNELSFDDSDWFTGRTGIGYGDNDDETVLFDMQGSYLSIFTRRAFQVKDPGDISRLVLRITYDDGFVAYLNGQEVARSLNMGPSGTHVSSTFAATSDHEAVTAESFVLDTGYLEQGHNLLAVEVHNESLSSGDLSFIPELLANPDLCPINISCFYDVTQAAVVLSWINRITYDSFDILRNGLVIGKDLKGTTQTYVDWSPLPGDAAYSVVATDRGQACPPLGCKTYVFSPERILIAVGEDWRFFRGSTAPPADWYKPVFDDSRWESGPTGIGYGDGDDATVIDDMQERPDDPATPGADESQPGYAGIFARKKFQLEDLDELSELVLSVIFDDGFVAYVNGGEVWRVNIPPGPDTERTLAIRAVEPGPPVQIRIPKALLLRGENLLAASIHNASLSSTDLSFLPTLGYLPVKADLLFRRGDVTSDGQVNLSDGITLLNHLFRGEPAPACADAADADDSGELNLTDAIFLLYHLFGGGVPPPRPGLSCGFDPTADSLTPCSIAGC
jgi:hypothetical protein